ncbi:type II toxin-antitoxin system Phd/YefM family antitoxin [Jiella avicenniae]|uniref:Prevent-host-death protein n=1 Tax=Jiella avicenniae TaxID=2907202 RepID=A0A9X1NXG6_9HYPH|nr:prevent-host-death protein [Jiella avicenniae]MCE7027317.1 prevent-host-death protein [Jiella avicenniae]
MSEVDLKDAHRDLVTLVERAAGGETVTVTKAGKAVATIAPVTEATERSDQGPGSRPSLAEYLQTLPVDIEFERNRSPSRDVDL